MLDFRHCVLFGEHQKTTFLWRAYRNKASSDWQIETCTLHAKKKMSSNDEFMATFVQIRDDQCMHDLAS